MRNHISLGVASLALALGWTTEARAVTFPFHLQTPPLHGPTTSFFGYSVAIDAGTAIIGAINDNGGKGAAYVYVASGGGWTLQQVLTSPASAVGDEFGYSVAISGDTAVVGSAGTSDVSVFVRSGNSWMLRSPIHDPDAAPQPGDCFGCSIALVGDVAIVGAPGKANGAGQADLFVRQGNSWSVAQTFTGQPGESYGFSVALSPDTNTALAGAFNASNEAGAAHLLTKNGATWTESQVLASPNAAPHGRFGYSVALQNDVGLVGASGQGGGEGAAYVFAKSGSGWSSVGPALIAPDHAPNDAFGISVALTNSAAIIGAYERSGPQGPGAAYVFTKSGSTWSSSQTLLATDAGQYFGYAVAASNDTTIVGAFGAPDTSALSDAGAAYLFLSPAGAPALGTSQWFALALALGGFGVLVLSKRHGEKLI